MVRNVGYVLRPLSSRDTALFVVDIRGDVGLAQSSGGSCGNEIAHQRLQSGLASQGRGRRFRSMLWPRRTTLVARTRAEPGAR